MLPLPVYKGSFHTSLTAFTKDNVQTLMKIDAHIQSSAERCAGGKAHQAERKALLRAKQKSAAMASTPHHGLEGGRPVLAIVADVRPKPAMVDQPLVQLGRAADKQRGREKQKGRRRQQGNEYAHDPQPKGHAPQGNE